MESIIDRINRNHFWKFHGGIHPPEQKTLSNERPIRSISLPELLVIPLQQHIGSAGELIVNKGDHVLKGQPLTKSHHAMAVPVHASTSGEIIDIKLSTVPHPSAIPELCIFLKPDNKETWRKRTVQSDYTELSRQEIIQLIADAGISGMGGAGFPTHIKTATNEHINYLIINAVECEPYITADDLLMREQAPSIVDGINILNHLLQADHILIGIEDNKPDAINAMKTATQSMNNVHICVVPTKYPSGGEKQLIQLVTGIELPKGSLPVQSGIVVQNVATCYAIANAVINDVPLIQRVVTVTGKALDKAQNLWAPIGTPIHHLLSNCGYHPALNNQLIMGGPMMGFSLPSADIPIIKTSNCIIAPTEEEISSKQEEVECIRCGQCAEVCPAHLLPQELQWSSKAKDHEQLKNLNLFDCIECGACAYVCPSQIPLVHYYRISKAEIRDQQIQDLKSEKAKVRFEKRKKRLENEKIKRELKHKQAAAARKAKMNSSTEGSSAKSAVAAALARVKAKKQSNNSANEAVDQPNKTQQPIAKTDDKKSQVSAAIARAKAKKLAAKQANEVADNTEEKSNIEQPVGTAEKRTTEEKKTSSVKNNADDDKKAKIAAAVLKAKQKKLKTATDSIESTVDESRSPEKTTEKHEENTKQATVGSSNSPESLSREQRIKAAIEKAKLKANKQQSSPASDQVNDSTTEQSAVASTSKAAENKSDKNDDERAKRIAKAIAKAKAKKQQAEMN